MPRPPSATSGSRPQPRRVAHDQIEAARREHVGEVALVVEPGELAPADDGPPRTPNGPKLRPRLAEPCAELVIGTTPLTEQVHAACGLEVLADPVSHLLLAVEERGLRGAALGRPELAHQCALPRAGGRDQGLT